MSDLLKNIDTGTMLAGTGKLEVLLFTLGKDNRTGREETFGINAFRVREVMRIPALTRIPEMPLSVEGMVSLRGVLVPVTDLARFIGIETDCKPEPMIITEYDGQMQGFLVRAVDNILHLDRSATREPPAMLQAEMGGLVTAITELNDGRLVMMLDAESVLAETGRFDNDEMVFKDVQSPGKESTVFLSDDPLAARDQIPRTSGVMQAKMSHGGANPDGGQDGIPDQNDSRTRPSGSGKLEILLFRLGNNEKFGINVLKVKEVCPTANITRTPNMPNGMDGIVLLHGHVMPVLNLATFMGMHPHQKNRTMLVTESNNHIVGLLVQRVNRVVRVDSDKVRATKRMLPDQGALVTAIIEMEDGSLVSILDMEHILAKAFGEAAVGNI